MKIISDAINKIRSGHGGKCFFLIIFAVTFSAFFFFYDITFSKDTRTEDVKRKLTEKKKKLSTVEEKETSALMRLNKALASMENQKQKLAGLRNEEAKLKRESEQIQYQIKDIEKNLAVEREIIKKRIAAKYKLGSGGYVQILFSAGTPLELSKRGKYVDSIVAWDKKTLLGYESKIALLKKAEREYEDKTASLGEAKARVEKQKGDFFKEKKKTETILSNIRKEKAKYQREVNNLEILSKKLETKIEQLQKNPKKDKIDITREGQKEVSLSALKGKFHPPVKGEIIVGFGKHKDPVLNVITQNKGIIIDSKDETKIKTIYRGKVIYADWLKGYGNLIVIDHGDNIYSLYARCMRIFVNQGDHVKDNQVIGSLENDKKERSYLYFELRQGTKPVNPAEWITFPKS